MSEEAPLGELLLRAAHTLRRRWGAVLEPWALSPHQARALRAVDDARGARVSDLAASLRIAPRSATEVVDGLQERGLVERIADPDDRRAVRVLLTDAGRTVRDQVEAARAADADELFARLDDTGRAQLAHLLTALVDTPQASSGGTTQDPAVGTGTTRTRFERDVLGARTSPP